MKPAETSRRDSRTAFLLRTNNFDLPTQTLARCLKAFLEAPIIVVCDESDGPVDVYDFDKISLTPKKLRKLGITNLPENWGWFCGDFCYYIAEQEMPGFEYYCLIESDVFFSDSAAHAFKSLLDKSGAEVLAAQLGPKPKNPKHSKGLELLGLNPNWGCIFPVTRVHSSVIPKMMELRIRNQNAPRGYLLNDEAILAGATYENGFSFENLSKSYPSMFHEFSFFTNPPYLYEGLINSATDLRIFHPVVPFEIIVNRILSGEKKYTRFRLRKVLEHASEEMIYKIDRALRERNEM